MIKSERGEALAISTRLTTALIRFNISLQGDAGAEFRSTVGKFLARFNDHVNKQVLGTEFYACFEQARFAGATLTSMNNVRLLALEEKPLYPLGVAIIDAAILFSFVEQSQIISKFVFRSRSEAASIMDTMTAIIENIKLTCADNFVSSDYQYFVGLAASLVQHLSATERLLPRIVRFSFPTHYPALAMSNRIYGDGSRSEELIVENKTVHPAFMQRNVVALSV
jgi:hypothetical protein